MRTNNPAQTSPSKAFSLALVVLPIFVVVYFSYLAAGFQLDDALIYLRYARNFHNGSGLVYNEAENFNGLTSPLFTALSVLGGYLVRDLQILSIGLSGVFLAGAALLGGRILSAGKIETALTASVLASVGYFYLVFGMETSLFLFLIALSVFLYSKGNPWFVVALALLATTRNEGVFLGLVLAADYLIKNRKLPDWRYIFVAAVIFLLPLFFNYFYYGELFPATGGAKIGQGKSGLWGGRWAFLNVEYFRDAFFAGSYFAPIVLLIMTALGLYFHRKSRLAWLIVVFLVLLFAFYAGVNVPSYHWYYAPFFYFAILFACKGVWRIGEKTLQSKTLYVIVPSFALVLVASLLLLSKLVSFETRGPSQYYVDIGNWLKENTPENTSVAMVEIGAVGWYSERNIVDILGLVTPYNAQLIGERKFMDWLLHYQPDYIIRHDPIWAHEQSVAPLEEQGLYVPREDAAVDGLVLLERSPSSSAESIRYFVSNLIEKTRSLEDMQKSSDVEPPFLLLQGDSLFAHAPSALELDIRNQTQSVRVGFGIREGAQGLHDTLCFSVRKQSDQATILEHCITAGTPAENMSVERVIQEQLPVGEKLLFDIRCEKTCDYAWTYWSKVEPELSTSFADVSLSSRRHD